MKNLSSFIKKRPRRSSDSLLDSHHNGNSGDGGDRISSSSSSSSATLELDRQRLITAMSGLDRLAEDREAEEDEERKQQQQFESFSPLSSSPLKFNGSDQLDGTVKRPVRPDVMFQESNFKNNNNMTTGMRSSSPGRATSSTPTRSRHESFRSRAQSGSDDHQPSGDAGGQHPSMKTTRNQLPRATLIDYFYSEVRRGYFLANDEQRFTEKRQKFYIFLKIPKELEKFIFYGFFQCVDAFLFIFTLLPIRFLLALWFLFSRSIKRTLSTFTATKRTYVPQPLLQPAEICDLLKGFILIFGAFMMNHVDTSILYHVIRSQSVIKLYIFYNMLEVADKLISSFGQDILDTLYWTATETRGKKREHLGVLPHLLLAIIYVYLHTNLILLQATSLNVALNSKNKALLTIMMSNNFVELKGMVFKKFEKNNLFHMSCCDVRERFHLLVLLLTVNIQTMKELNWAPEEFWTMLPDCICIFLAEFGVDWVKHAFVTRFNEISYEVYHQYTISIAYDLASSKLKSAFSDHSDLISRRMGFIPLPLGLLVYRIFSVSVPIQGWYGYTCLVLGYLCLCTFKFWINIYLLGKACDLIETHRAGMEKKAPTSRQCASLPSSRHHSQENLTTIGMNPNSKSTPHTPIASQSSSLADITAHASIIQETLENSLIFSDSTVSLNSFEMNDGSELRLRRLKETNKENEIPTKIMSPVTKTMAATTATAASSAATASAETSQEPHRRISLQEQVNYNFLDLPSK